MLVCAGGGGVVDNDVGFVAQVYLAGGASGRAVHRAADVVCAVAVQSSFLSCIMHGRPLTSLWVSQATSRHLRLVLLWRPRQYLHLAWILQSLVKCSGERQFLQNAFLGSATCSTRILDV